MQFDSYTPEQLQQMSPNEQRAVKNNRFSLATSKHVIEKICHICRMLGTNYYSGYEKYYWSVNNIGVFVDDYGNFSTVTLTETRKKVMSTHPNDKFIIPGDWIDKVLSFYPEVEKILIDREKQKEDKQREELMRYLV
jgi:hypothetical protein